MMSVASVGVSVCASCHCDYVVPAGDVDDGVCNRQECWDRIHVGPVPVPLHFDFTKDAVDVVIFQDG